MYGVFMGQKNVSKIREVEKYYVKISFITALIIWIIILSTLTLFPTFFTENSDIIKIAWQYAITLAVFFFIFPFIFMQIAIFQISWKGTLRIIHTMTILSIITALQIFAMRYSLNHVFWFFAIGQFIWFFVFMQLTLKIRWEKILKN